MKKKSRSLKLVKKMLTFYPISNEFEYVTGEETLLLQQGGIIDQAKFAYSSLGKAFGKQTTAIGEQGSKKVKAIERHGK